MGETNSAIAANVAADRSFAIRSLLAAPLLDASANPDAFGAVVRHRDWLAEYFDQSCGWPLSVDVIGRYARLTKRSAAPDASRPAVRARSGRQPFDRRRYELLCLAAAELASHPVTTIGILAGALAAGGERRLDTAKQRERAAFVDALHLLAGLGVVRFEGGDVDDFVSSEHGNALIVVDVARLHRLPATDVAPSRVEPSLATDAAVASLVAEPRYGEAGNREDEVRNRWARHTLLRRLLDDPVVHLDDLSDEERTYLATPAGRKLIRDRVAEAGFELEERAEGMLAVDPDAVATDIVFPAPASNVKQAALVLIDLFVRDVAGRRSLVPSEWPAVVAKVRHLLDEHPRWARDYQDDDGAHRLARASVGLLRDLGLVRVIDGDRVEPRPALARYAAAPVDTGALFD